MNHTTLVAFAILLLAACKKDDPQPTPQPAPAPYICCPTSAPVLVEPANAAVLTLPVTFRWRSVPNTAQYAISAPCQWEGPAGQQYTANLIQASVTDTFITLTQFPSSSAPWSGAEGTWQVIALGSDNTQGPWSLQRAFTVQ